jgi:hypothetical protein
MKLFKRILVLALMAVMVLTMVACGGDKTDAGNNGPVATPKPTPKLLICDLEPQQLTNYYVEYTVTETIDGVETTRNVVEVCYSTVILRSQDGGETFAYDMSGVACFTVTDTAKESSFFSSHIRYEKDQLQNKGTETVAGKECTYYYFKNGLFKYHMYVDETVGSTGMTLKYIDEKVDGNGNILPTTIEVTKLEFGTMDTAKFTEYTTKVVTPATAEPAPEA